MGMDTSRETDEPQKILIVDHQPLILRGLSMLIDSTSDLNVCATALTQREGVELIAVYNPDLVLTEFPVQDEDGFSLLTNIRLHDPARPVLIFSGHEAPSYVRAAFDAGANGYVSKREIDEHLLFALRQVLAGKSYLSQHIRI